MCYYSVLLTQYHLTSQHKLSEISPFFTLLLLNTNFHMCNISPLSHRLCAFWCVLALLPLTTADEAEKLVSDEDDFTLREHVSHHLHTLLLERSGSQGVAIQSLRCCYGFLGPVFVIFWCS